MICFIEKNFLFRKDFSVNSNLLRISNAHTDETKCMRNNPMFALAAHKKQIIQSNPFRQAAHFQCHPLSKITDKSVRNITIKMIHNWYFLCTGLLRALFVPAVGEVGDQGQHISFYKFINVISPPSQSHETDKQEPSFLIYSEKSNC